MSPVEGSCIAQQLEQLMHHVFVGVWIVSLSPAYHDTLGLLSSQAAHIEWPISHAFERNIRSVKRVHVYRQESHQLSSYLVRHFHYIDVLEVADTNVFNQCRSEAHTCGVDDLFFVA